MNIRFIKNRKSQKNKKYRCQKLELTDKNKEEDSEDNETTINDSVELMLLRMILSSSVRQRDNDKRLCGINASSNDIVFVRETVTTQWSDSQWFSSIAEKKIKLENRKQKAIMGRKGRIREEIVEGEAIRGTKSPNQKLEKGELRKK